MQEKLYATIIVKSVIVVVFVRILIWRDSKGHIKAFTWREAISFIEIWLFNCRLQTWFIFGDKELEFVDGVDKHDAQNENCTKASNDGLVLLLVIG